MNEVKVGLHVVKMATTLPSFCVKTYILQSNLSYVTYQRKIEIWSHKTGDHYIQV